jgi:hypothetical protein
MIVKREHTINIIDVMDAHYVQDLNPYEIITLYTLDFNKYNNYNDTKVHITKSGGIWPILLFEFYRLFELSENDLKKAIEFSLNNIHLNQNKIYNENKNNNISSIYPYPTNAITNFLTYLISEVDPIYNISIREVLQTIYDSSIINYKKTIISLEQKNLILDPYDPDNFIELTDELLQTYNLLTPQGREKLEKVYHDATNNYNFHRFLRLFDQFIFKLMEKNKEQFINL